MKSDSSSSVGNKIITTKFSIIIPTTKHYTILNDLINKIKNNIPDNVSTEVLLIQDISNGPQQDSVSGVISSNSNLSRQSISNVVKVDKLISIRHIQDNFGKRKISALMHGIKSSSGENVIVLNDNFTHPPEMLPKIMESLLNNANCIVVATPNVKVGSFGRIELLGRLIIKKTARTMFRLFSPEKVIQF